jgi:hypothetical protein
MPYRWTGAYARPGPSDAPLFAEAKLTCGMPEPSRPGTEREMAARYPGTLKRHSPKLRRSAPA